MNTLSSKYINCSYTHHHISFTASEEVKQICTALFQKLNLNAFSYSRVYLDGSRVELWSDPYALEHTFLRKKYIVGVYSPSYLEEGKYFLYEDKIKSYPATIYERYSNQLCEQRDLFDHDNCFMIKKEEHDATEFFIFYSSRNSLGMVNRYFNHLQELDNFTLYFKSCAKKLIVAADKSPIILPWRNVEKLSRRKFHRLKSHPFSEQEIRVANLLLEGNSAKEIANYLMISPKTAEQYLYRIKNKLGASKRSHVITELKKMKIF